jgi:hypothetical protein
VNFSGSAHQTAGPQLAGHAAARPAGPQLGHAGPQLGHAVQRQAQLGHAGPVHSQLTALQAQRDLHPICVLGMSRGN